MERPVPRPRVPTRWLLAGGVAGPLLFVAIILAQDLTRPGYDAARQFISVLGLGDEGWVQALNFVVSGLLILAGAVGLARQLPRSGLVRWIPRLIGMTGLAFVISGLFPADPQLGYPYWISVAEVANPTWHSRIHFASGFVATAAYAVALAVAAVVARGRGERWAAVHAAVSVGILVACSLAGLALESPGLGVPAIGGLLQRIGLVAGLQWLVWCAWTVLRHGAATQLGAPGERGRERAGAPGAWESAAR